MGAMVGLGESNREGLLLPIGLEATATSRNQAGLDARGGVATLVASLSLKLLHLRARRAILRSLRRPLLPRSRSRAQGNPFGCQYSDLRSLVSSTRATRPDSVDTGHLPSSCSWCIHAVHQTTRRRLSPSSTRSQTAQDDSTPSLRREQQPRAIRIPGLTLVELG